jgi:hypothetical protein
MNSKVAEWQSGKVAKCHAPLRAGAAGASRLPLPRPAGEGRGEGYHPLPNLPLLHLFLFYHASSRNPRSPLLRPSGPRVRSYGLAPEGGAARGKPAPRANAPAGQAQSRPRRAITRAVHIPCALIVLLLHFATLPLCHSATLPQDAHEQYLAQHNLHDALAALLRDRLERAPAEDRVPIATRLAALYVRMLETLADPADRIIWENRSRELLRLVPEAESLDLRISLAKAQYLVAETAAERQQLRLATGSEQEEAERILRASLPVFQEIATRAHREVEFIERRRETARGPDDPAQRAALDEARRVRSLAHYYAGWSCYYLGAIAGKGGAERYAVDGLRHFGWLLNASEGKLPNLERIAEGLLRYEHVARAALGVALCEGLRGNGEDALRWFEKLQSSGEVPPSVRDQIFPRRLAALASAGKWADVHWYADRERQRRGKDGDPAPLETAEARLIAVRSMEALSQATLPDRARPLIEQIAAAAMEDLIERGEVAHVLDLVELFGSAPMTGEGFIFAYVRGLRAYDDAREAHEASSAPPDEPAAADEVIARYRGVSDSLDGAARAPDAARYPRERSNAMMVAALARYYAGDLAEAARRFARAHAEADSPDQAEEAMWLAVVALDRAVENDRPSLRPEFHRVVEIYLRSYPSSERAARLLLRQATEGVIDDEDAVRILLDVPESSPLYEAARRHAAAILFRLASAAPSARRDFAAARFLTVAEPLVELDRRRIVEGPPDQADSAADAAIKRIRQILAITLQTSSPDLARAEAVLQTLDQIAARRQINLGDLNTELTYRRLQIALHRGAEPEADRLLAELRQAGGPYADAAEREAYRRAREVWARSPDDPRLARRTLLRGARVIAQFRTDASALSSRPVQSLYDAVAAAAEALWNIEQDEQALQQAILLDQRMVDAGGAAPTVLRRLARLSEAAGDLGPALDAWRRLLSGLPQGSGDWYEARYHSLRLLWQLEPQSAREVMTQHRLLHPDFGPEPWGERLRALNGEMAETPEPAQTPSDSSQVPPPARPSAPPRRRKRTRRANSTPQCLSSSHQLLAFRFPPLRLITRHSSFIIPEPPHDPTP